MLKKVSCMISLWHTEGILPFCVSYLFTNSFISNPDDRVRTQNEITKR